jgi:hypothetical protein
MHPDRLKKLARHIESLAATDRERIRREREIETLRRGAAEKLHAMCLQFVEEVNTAVSSVRLEVAPPEFTGDAFHEAGPNVFQIHVSGRVIQFLFEGTEPLITTENLRTPYTLEGSVRWFNQEMLDRDEIKDQKLFYCVDRNLREWRFYDSRTHRSGSVGEDYLATLLEQLV